MGSRIRVFFTIFLFLLLQSEAETPESLLKELCVNSKNPNFCMETFNADPRTSSANDILSLAKIGLDLATKDSLKTRDHIQELSASKMTEPQFKPALNLCVESYNGIAASFRSAYGEVEEGEYETANYDTLIAADDAGNCNKSLANAKARIQSVADKIQVTRYFSDIGDRVTTLL
ncbi:pectinesterase inhibitor-like [Manihot esculenta]|uniref:Uncharacterized protein n=1 Tax=Manihot esculenta TaxID=3983 RepID=A0ACB7I8G8_MANES|nr:pectinesterase inhibitor-like [Manihot esculenta]KAG8660691.1 hypothetical protein MANES_02G182301v8 [Manihot esculenta]